MAERALVSHMAQDSRSKSLAARRSRRIGRGVLYAIANTCSHRGGDLSKGTIQDGIVQCPRHGSRFDVRTGKNVRGLKVLGKRWTTGDVRAYPVTVDGEDILLGGE